MTALQRATLAAAVLVLLALCLAVCEPPSSRTVFCRTYAGLGCAEVWGEDCASAFDELERTRGAAFCPRDAAGAHDCDELAARTVCP